MTTTKIETGISKILNQRQLDRRDVWPQRLQKITFAEVERAMAEQPGQYSLRKLAALVSPAAEGYIEQMAQTARSLTIQRFGRTIRLYAPLYLSNFCSNSCRYCGFNRANKFKRTRLTIGQAVEEADVLAAEGFREILLVSGEDRKFISQDYLCELAQKLKTRFSLIAMEVYRMTNAEYAGCLGAGIEAVTIYQETYDRDAYAYYHPEGTKSDYEKRLTAPEDIAAAGIRQVGIGVLLGLADWRTEILALAEHACCLMKKHWKTQISFSFPRLRPAHNVEEQMFKNLPSDKNLLQMITALRLCFADAGIVISTRENAALRDNLVKIAVTKISTGSKTNPGGYRIQPISRAIRNR